MNDMKSESVKVKSESDQVIMLAIKNGLDIGRVPEFFCQPGTHFVKSENMKSKDNRTRQNG